jgi:hypothetical protein
VDTIKKPQYRFNLMLTYGLLREDKSNLPIIYLSDWLFLIEAKSAAGWMRKLV